MSAPPVSEITAILVSWRDADDLEEAVRSLAEARRAIAAPGPVLSLVAVGNGPGSVRPERVRALWPDAAVIENAHNLGFGPAANQGAAAARGDVLLFLNPDTRAEEDPFSPLDRGFRLRPEAVALAPRLLEPNGEIRSASPGALAPPGDEDQFTFQLRRLPRLSSDARELLLWDHLFPSGVERRRARYADEDRDRPFAVEQAAGAALAVRADAFRRIGGFDESFVPAWFEDVDLCARLLGEGAILYWPESRFRHAGGISSARLGYDRFLPILYANALRYRAKHYPPAARAVYRGLLAAGMILRLAALPLRREMPRRRAEAARAYAGVLRLLGGARPGGVA